MPNNKPSCKEETFSIFYHDIFDYPLTLEELKKWKVGCRSPISNFQSPISKKGVFYFINGRQNIIKKRLQNEAYSREKLEIVKKVSNLLRKILTIKGVFLTGALAMKNAGKNSDIDLMIITKANTLWMTRVFAYLVLRIMNYGIRKPKDQNQKDKLCLNIWLDEQALSWDKKDRNIYSAHEITQVAPIINKENIYQRFLQKNKWILGYWPSAAKISSAKDIKLKVRGTGRFISQYLYIFISFECDGIQIAIPLYEAQDHPRSSYSS